MLRAARHLRVHHPVVTTWLVMCLVGWGVGLVALAVKS